MFRNFARRAVLAAAISAVAFGTMGFQSNDGNDRRVLIINATGVTMTHFYASNSGRNDWEEDILGEDVLRSGGSVRINIDDGTGACLYDFKAEFTGAPWPPMPRTLLALWRDLTGWPEPPDACLVNLYRGPARMGLHQDLDEQDHSAPVLSISLGDTAVFRIGAAGGGPTGRFGWPRETSAP